MYTALLVVTIMLTGALAMSVILSRQIPATAELLHSERAFYAARSGSEQALFMRIVQDSEADTVAIPAGQSVEYDLGDNATYSGTLSLSSLGRPCGLFVGEYRTLIRRINQVDPSC